MIVTLAALALAAPSAPPPLPAIRRVPPPVVVIRPPAAPAPSPGFGIRATGLIDYPGPETRADFIVDDRGALLRMTTEGAPRFRAIRKPWDALAILSDQRLAFLWPALVAWAGPDLIKLRDLNVATTRAAFERGAPGGPASSTSQSLVTERAHALLQYAAALGMAGRGGEAKALLARERDRYKGGDGFDAMMIGLNLANTLNNEGDATGALRAIDDLARTLAAREEYALNIKINRAAYLAEAGRYAEALEAIDAAFAAFEAQEEDKHTYKVANSTTQFAWIRACALKGLGREAESRAAFAPVRGAGDRYDPYAVLTSSLAIRLRGYRCMGDVDGVVEQLLVDLEAGVAGQAAFLWLQPALTEGMPDPELIEAVRADPRIVAALRGRLRPLPEAMVPALRRWSAAGVNMTLP